ncbi:hypothetical protein Vadar_009563 [Vaccinium darrowii]|uniref:Uncharacterized protein n=1 Tax=Vaccinium darrowii TaxID=229202 RepID=A0ACB7ZBG6_9ERIC|nr:hypothetical protein Vadar_009563 [Vaccinium darrowii]
MATPDSKHREAEETTARGDEDTGAQADHKEAEETTAGNDEDTGAQIAPVVKLEEVAITTGEEEEDAIVDLKAKLYRFDKEGNQWKERGAGTVKLLRHRETGKVRLVMRQSKTLKICANHLVGPTMSVQEYLRNDKACIWHAADFSDGELKDEFFCMRFGSIDGKAKFAITKDQTLHLKEGKDHTVHHFDYLVPTESLAMPLLGPERMSDALGLKRAYEAEGYKGMKVNKELLAKLRADRGAIVEGELARKRQKLGREAKDMDPRSSVDSGVTDHQGVAVFERPRADKGKKPEEAINTTTLLSKSGGKKPLNINEPFILVDPKEALNCISKIPFPVDMRNLDKLSDEELCEKGLVSLRQMSRFMYATTKRCLTNFQSSLGMEDMVRKATTEKEDLRLQLDQQRTMKNQLKLDIVLKDVQLQSYADVVSARDKEIVDLKQKVLCLQNSEAKAKEAGAMEYKKSQGFTDSMTIYFFEGFEAFRRRSMAAYPGVDFKIFEADDDLQSLIAGEEGGASVIDDGISKGKPSHVVDEKRVHHNLWSEHIYLLHQLLYSVGALAFIYKLVHLARTLWSCLLTQLASWLFMTSRSSFWPLFAVNTSLAMVEVEAVLVSVARGYLHQVVVLYHDSNILASVVLAMIVWAYENKDPSVAAVLLENLSVEDEDEEPASST